jgi:hypothetical protein
MGVKIARQFSLDGALAGWSKGRQVDAYGAPTSWLRCASQGVSASWCTGPPVGWQDGRSLARTVPEKLLYTPPNQNYLLTCHP